MSVTRKLFCNFALIQKTVLKWCKSRLGARRFPSFVFPVFGTEIGTVLCSMKNSSWPQYFQIPPSTLQLVTSPERVES